jgi:hypothetical protein
MKDLGMNKVSARWIPKLLNSEQKLCRQHICQENLKPLTDDEELSSKISRDDKTWVYHWDPPTRIHAAGPQGISTAKNAKTKNSSGKMMGMATVFRDMKGILPIEYKKKVYKETIRKLKSCNCRVHKARRVREVIDEWGFVKMEHPPYRPDS